MGPQKPSSDGVGVKGRLRSGLTLNGAGDSARPVSSKMKSPLKLSGDIGGDGIGDATDSQSAELTPESNPSSIEGEPLANGCDSMACRRDASKAERLVDDSATEDTLGADTPEPLWSLSTLTLSMSDTRVWRLSSASVARGPRPKTWDFGRRGHEESELTSSNAGPGFLGLGGL